MRPSKIINVSKNKELGLATIVKNLETKYKISAKVKTEIKKNIKNDNYLYLSPTLQFDYETKRVFSLISQQIMRVGNQNYDTTKSNYRQPPVFKEPMDIVSHAFKHIKESLANLEK